ncbi:ribonuclease III [bacterium]|nr:ribonuclease III [bacterium]NIN92159.1 ribonuclease III [bacterium]NIO18817.1 ribonuclease III [bacterium]NIO73901.1 ribonuclease III [bacterium]
MNLKNLEKKLKINFKNKKLLQQALTHKSYAHMSGIKEDNERLEFLGDSVLNLVVSEYLYHRYPTYDEGKLTKVKSSLVNRKSLLLWAKKLSLGDYLLVSEEEEAAGGRQRASLLSNALEAIIGAIYQDQDWEKAKKFIMGQISTLKGIRKVDYKSRLQELIQKRYRILPEYRVKTESGPAHKKFFEIEVKVKSRIFGRGAGWNKKTAEQEAAKKALRKIKTKKQTKTQ